MTKAQQDELIVEHLPQAHFVAKRIFHRIRRRIPLEDLEQYGALGLIVAAAHFDPTRGLKFKTYAEHRIRGAILDAIRKETHCRSGQDTQPIEWISFEGLGVTERRDESSERELLAVEAKIDSDRLLKHCTSIQKRALRGMYLEEKSQGQVGIEMGYPQSRVSQLATKARERLRAVA
jgi:RNA polymerase sigma factor (sigma-70 family)